MELIYKLFAAVFVIFCVGSIGTLFALYANQPTPAADVAGGASSSTPDPNLPSGTPDPSLEGINQRLAVVEGAIQTNKDTAQFGVNLAQAARADIDINRAQLSSVSDEVGTLEDHTDSTRSLADVARVKADAAVF